MEWMIWAFVIWIMLNAVGRRSCGWDRRYERRLHRAWSRSGRYGTPPVRLQVGRGAPWDWREAVESRRAVAQGRQAAGKPAAPQETPEERIRRRFVEGRIDLDQYEAELWEELKPRGS